MALCLRRAGFDDAKRQPASGNNPLRPADVVSREAELMVECKMTHRVTMSFDHRWVQRVWERAQQFGYRGVVALRFLRKWPEKPEDYVVIPQAHFIHLLQCEAQLSESILGDGELRNA